MSGYMLKASTVDVTYDLDWNEGYLEHGETIVSDLGWQIQPVCEPGDLFVKRQSIDVRFSHVELGGGLAGKTYILSAKAETSQERVLERSVVLQVAV